MLDELHDDVARYNARRTRGSQTASDALQVTLKAKDQRRAAAAITCAYGLTVLNKA